VETRTVLDDGSVWDVSPSGHRANPKLRNLLDEVLSDAGPAPEAAPAAPVAAATPAPPAEVVEGWSSSAVAAWAGVGALAGVLLTLVALRRRQRPPVTSMVAPLT
jgi:hypothetical protein